MEPETNRMIIRAIRAREPLPQTHISLKKLLNYAGLAPGYLGMVGDSIAQEELIDGEDIEINYIDFPDLLVTAKGLKIISPILENYLPHDVISDADALIQSDYSNWVSVEDIAAILRNMTVIQLLNACVKCSPDQRVIYQTELQERFPVVIAVRKLKVAVNDLRVRVKYRNIFKTAESVAMELKEEMDKEKFQEG